MPDRVYIIEPPRDAYQLEDCDEHVEVVHDEVEHTTVRDAVILTLPGEPGEPGPPGPTPTTEVVAEQVALFETSHPEHFVWDSPGAVSVVDFDHPLPYDPNVQLIDSAGTVWLVVPHITPGHVHIDLGGMLMSVTVTLS